MKAYLTRKRKKIIVTPENSTQYSILYQFYIRLNISKPWQHGIRSNRFKGTIPTLTPHLLLRCHGQHNLYYLDVGGPKVSA